MCLLKNKKILITGGGGFLGFHLANRLLYNNGIRVVGYKFDKFPYFDEGIFLDLTKYENCLLVTKNVDYVFHFAAKMGGIKYITEQGSSVITNNILTNANMIKASVENRVEKFFFPSSFCVYPEHLQKTAYSLKEVDAIPASPDTFYGWEKLFTEQMLNSYKEKIKIRIARLVSIYGSEMPYTGGQEKSLPAICRKVIEAPQDGEIEIWGDGNQVRSFCYIEDCLDAIEKIMEGPRNSPFNVSGEAISIKEIADQAIKFSKKNLTIKYNLNEVKGVDIRLANIDKIKIDLNWSPKVKFEEGLERTFNWIKEDVRL